MGKDILAKRMSDIIDVLKKSKVPKDMETAAVLIMLGVMATVQQAIALLKSKPETKPKSKKKGGEHDEKSTTADQRRR